MSMTPSNSYELQLYQFLYICPFIPVGLPVVIVSAFQPARCSCVTVYCKDGELKDDAGVCVPCARGYYKNNTEYEFGPCNICPTNYTTPGVGAPSKDNCTISKLTLL